MEKQIHQPVLLKEVLEYLDIQPDDIVVDATFGFGGHSNEIAKRLKSGMIIAIEKDPSVVSQIQKSIDPKKITLISDDFGNIKQILKRHGIEQVDKILFDLGISSYHFDSSKRGFTFQKDEPLDMRLNQSVGVTAADLVNGLTASELADMFYALSDERFSRQIAKAIVEARRKKKFETTGELVRVVMAVKRPVGKIHPATKVFQALRICVNDELGVLDRVLPQAIDFLKSSGRIAVISFHSGEDRIVKNIFRNQTREKKLDLLNKKPVQASEEEIKKNPRSRSARLRVAKRRS